MGCVDVASGGGLCRLLNGHGAVGIPAAVAGAADALRPLGRADQEAARLPGPNDRVLPTDIGMGKVIAPLEAQQPAVGALLGIVALTCRADVTDGRSNHAASTRLGLCHTQQ